MISTSSTLSDCWRIHQEGSYALADIISAAYSRLVTKSMPLLTKATLLDKLSVLSTEATRVYNERLQFIGFISVLQETRLDLVRRLEVERSFQEAQGATAAAASDAPPV